MILNFGKRKKETVTPKPETQLLSYLELYAEEANDEYIMKFINLVAAGCVFYVPIERLDNDDPSRVSFGVFFTTCGKCIPVFTSKKEYAKGPDDYEIIPLDIGTIIYYAFVIEEPSGLVVNPFSERQSFLSMRKLGVILYRALTKDPVPDFA